MNIEDVILEAVREEGREEGFKEGIEKGIEEGKQKALLQIVLRMKKAGLSIADIAKATGLTIEQIRKL